MAQFVEVIKNKFLQEKRPLVIGDICCGYSLTTLVLREKLLNSGVEIHKIVGYDISSELIEIAQQNNTFFPEV
jgi:hypothetical protein